MNLNNRFFYWFFNRQIRSLIKIKDSFSQNKHVRSSFGIYYNMYSMSFGHKIILCWISKFQQLEILEEVIIYFLIHSFLRTIFSSKEKRGAPKKRNTSV